MLKSIQKSNFRSEYIFVPVKKYEHYSDEQIIEKVVAGSTPLFEIIMRRYNQRLFRIQRTYINNEDAVKDTLQLTYIQAYQHLHQFRGDAKFSTWLTRIAINEALKYHNKQKRYLSVHKFDTDNDSNYDMESDQITPEEELIQADLRELLEHTVDQLPSIYRTVYMMREIEDIGSKETADCLKISEANVKVRLFRAKKMLRDKLERSVSDAEIFNFLGERCDLIVLNVMHKISKLDENKD
ncbi:MAG: RNA polymerase sigma factor [Balneolaceae bacterium]